MRAGIRCQELVAKQRIISEKGKKDKQRMREKESTEMNNDKNKKKMNFKRRRNGKERFAY